MRRYIGSFIFFALGAFFLAHDLMHEVSHGAKFLGQDVEKGNALYLALEDSERRLKDRVLKLGHAFNRIHPTVDVEAPYIGFGLEEDIQKWIDEKINLVLKSLIDLKNLKESNSSIRALAYQLYENNGVLKREIVSEYLKKLGQDERKILRNMGVKFGRYHVFLFKLLWLLWLLWLIWQFDAGGAEGLT